MKKAIFSLVCILTVYVAVAQSSFGVISYTLPEGWIAVPAGDNLEIMKKHDESGSCRITLFKQLNTATSTERQFMALWATKAKGLNAAALKTASPSLTAEDGWVSISATAKASDGSGYTQGFFTLCDNSITAMILVQAADAACLKEINAVMATFNIQVTTNSKTRAKSKKTKFPYVYRAISSSSKSYKKRDAPVRDGNIGFAYMK